MNKNISQILEQISKLEEKLEKEIKIESKKFNFDFQGKKVCFNKKSIDNQKKHLENLFSYIKNAPILYILSAPIIYSLIIPAIILDITVLIYQSINFRIYKIEPVKREEYIVFDRIYLAYLNPIEKLNCLYCSYFNGLIAYVSEIAARTELFWCPIKHAKNIAYRHSKYNHFFSYGDAKKFKEELKSLREQLKEMK